MADLDRYCVAVTALSLLPKHIERQTDCLDSWKQFGLTIHACNRSEEIEPLQQLYPQISEWHINDDRCESYAWQTQLIRNLAMIADKIDHTVLLINSDIEIYGPQNRLIDAFQTGRQVAGIRWNYPHRDYLHHAKREKWGLDAFSFTPELARSLPKLPLAIGRPIWDYWIPLHARTIGQEMEFIGERLFYHQIHSIHWSRSDWMFCAKILQDHYQVDLGPDALGFRCLLPFPPPKASWPTSSPTPSQ